MKILKNQGTFEVLSKSDDIIGAIARSARTCCQSQDKASPENDIKLVKNLITRGHGAMLEFADMTVRFDNCSRGFTHEMIRHRLCSFAQESTRYVDEKEFEFIVPPHRDETEKVEVSDYETMYIPVENWLQVNSNVYRELRDIGWKPEDARQVLPNALKSEIVVKADMREWRHIFDMRTSEFAHWEIRKVMVDLLKWSKQNIPLIFDDFFVYEKNGIEYGHKVMSKFNLQKEIEFYNMANPNDKI